MITLLSDWKLRDPYIGIFKGQLLKELPQEQMVDITHYLEMFNPSQTAFVLKNSYPYFPEKTIHIVLAGLTFSTDTKPVLVLYNGHFFLGEDTGVFYMMFGTESSYEAWQYNGDMSIPVTEKLVKMASWVTQNIYKNHTTPYPSLKFQLSNLSEADYNPERKTISGKVVFVDSYCNAVTNIPVSMLESALESAGKRTFTATVSTHRPLKITRCHPCYNPSETDIYLVHNQFGFLEITLFNGNIAAMADIHPGNSIEIQIL